MERMSGIQSGIKKLTMVLFLMAALATTGCGQNALLNPTMDQVVEGGQDVNAASNSLNPASNSLNP